MQTVNFGGCFIACERAKEECGAQSDRRPSWVRPTLLGEFDAESHICSVPLFISQLLCGKWKSVRVYYGNK